MPYSYFHDYVQSKKGEEIIVQPRMGFGQHDLMRKGLEAVKGLSFNRIGTITLDSYTRTRNFHKVSQAMESGHELNGYPIVFYGKEKNRALLEHIYARDFPVQVRHGSALPYEIFDALIAAGIGATEGGAVSYCLPYSRVPLRQSFGAWARSVETLAKLNDAGYTPHIESFGGCMMGQLCPPSMLVAITLIEGMHFTSIGMKSISLSYSQGTNSLQDIGGIRALHRLATKFLAGTSVHVVVYTFMGMFPETYRGSKAIIEESAKIAKISGAERLIVKTPSEARSTPQITDNLTSLRWAADAAAKMTPDGYNMPAEVSFHEEKIFEEASFLVELVLNQDAQLAIAVEKSFKKGFWDVPYCLHSENKNKCRSCLENNGCIYWADFGCIPFPKYIARETIKRKHRIGSSVMSNAN